MGLFGVSDKARQKMVTKSVEVSDAPQTDVVVGQRKFTMTSGAWVFAAVIVVVVVALAIVLRTLPIPGALFLVLFLNMTKPRRILAIGPGGYTSFKGSMWSALPQEVVGSAPTVQLLNDTEVTVGHETITMSKKEMEHLKLRMNSGMAPTASPPPLGAPPFQASALGTQDQGSFSSPPLAKPPQGQPAPGPPPQQPPLEPFQQ